jgi:hypothetical protein
MSVTNKNICFFLNCATIIEKARVSKENEPEMSIAAEHLPLLCRDAK